MTIELPTPTLSCCTGIRPERTAVLVKHLGRIGDSENTASQTLRHDPPFEAAQGIEVVLLWGGPH